MKRLAPILIWLLAGCAVNPVTGERELILVTSEQELAMGAQNYVPTQQSQGGPYDVDPNLTGYISAIGERLADASGVPLPYEFVVLNNSVPNAWALPGGKIAVNRGLLTEMQSEAELAAVLGHEIVHAAARHTAQQLSRSMLLQGLVVATSVASSDSSYGNLAVGGAGVAAQLLTMRYGRGAELEADKYGMRYMSTAGYDPAGAVDLQRTFVRLSEGRNESWLSGLFASHPPSQERVNANIATAAKLPAGGERGEERFGLAMQKTRDAKPAYDAYDEGRKALAEGKTDEALQLAEKAIGLFPNEAHFHALRGDVRLTNKQFDMAITNYDRAISRRKGFFYYPLQRGLARYELGQIDVAADDLQASIVLLPSAPAHYTLGEIEARRGNRAAAIAHYQIVAKSGGEYGRAASEALVRLDLADNPGNYIARRCDAGATGNLVVSVRNETSLAIMGVVVLVTYTDTYGREQRLQLGIGGRLAPGQVASRDTGIGPYRGGSCPAEVVAAELAEST